MQLTPGLDAAEAALLEAVSANELLELAAMLTGEVRLSGSPEELRALERAASLLQGWGFATRMLFHDGYISLPGPATLEIEALGDITCITHAFGLSTPPTGLSAPIIDLGAGTPVDWAVADARGKIALVDGLATPEMAYRARLAGTAGQIYINDDHLHEMILSPVWGNPTLEQLAHYPEAPAVSVRAGDGARIRAAVIGASLIATITAEVTTGWRTLPLLQADLPGTDDDTFVLFAGHIDSWHYGAMDNGSANATMLHLARLLAERRDQLRRGLRICFWSGHSHGRYAGSAWYVDTHWDELRRRCAAYVNIDSVGGQGATVLSEGYCMAETHGLGQEIIKRYTGEEYCGSRVGRAGDESLVGVGVPALLMTVSEQPATGEAAGAASVIGGRSGGLGWWWHTPDDTLDKLDPALLARDARLYAAAIFRLCAEPLLPLDYTAACAELDDLVAGYQELLGERFDLGPARAQSQALRNEAAELGVALEHRRAQMTAGAVLPDLSAINTGLMELGRATIPFNYTAAGPFGHDPALFVPPLPLLAAANRLAAAPAGSDEVKHAAVALQRGLNQLAFGLENARVVVARLRTTI